MDSISDYIKKRLGEKKKPEVIKYELLAKGFLEADVDKAVKKYSGESTKSYVVEKFVLREFFFKLSSGFGNDQFIYIFIYLLTSSYLILGLSVGFSVILSLLASFLLQDYFKIKKITKTAVVLIGVAMTVCYVFIGLGVFYELGILVIAFMLILSLLNVLLGEVYSKTYGQKSEERTESFLLTKISGYSLIFVVIGLLIGAYVLEKYEFGYIYVFIIAGVSVLISSIALISLLSEKIQIETTPLNILVKQRLRDVKKFSKMVFKNKVVKMLAIGTTITGIIQTAGITFYGLFVYQYFTNIGYGGFWNVAIVFAVPIITSLFSTTMAKLLSKQYGNVPALVFGTLLIAILPLTMWLKPNLISISMAMVCAVIGGAMVGLSTGLLLSNNVEPDLRGWYFQAYTLIVALAYLIFIPIASVIAEYGNWFGLMSLQMLFAIMSIVLVIIVVPVYFAIFFIEKKKVV